MKEAGCSIAPPSFSRNQINLVDALSYLQFLGDDPYYEFRLLGGSTPLKLRASLTGIEDQITIRNTQMGYDVYVTVQGTDGKGVKMGNVNAVRALFVDLDGSPIGPVMNCEHPPHLVVNTSPGKYHAYWKVEMGFPLDLYTPAQKALVELFDGDHSCTDLPRIMRVPGFWHLKEEPYLSHIVSVTEAVTPLTAEQVRSWLGVRAVKIKDHVPSERPGDAVLAHNNVLDDIVRHGLYTSHDKGSRHLVKCPWSREHTDPTDTRAFYWEPAEDNDWMGGFFCHHSHCRDKDRRIGKFRNYLIILERDDV